MRGTLLAKLGVMWELGTVVKMEHSCGQIYIVQYSYSRYMCISRSEELLVWTVSTYLKMPEKCQVPLVCCHVPLGEMDAVIKGVPH